MTLPFRFESQHPDKGRDLNSIFSSQVIPATPSDTSHVTRDTISALILWSLIRLIPLRFISNMLCAVRQLINLEIGSQVFTMNALVEASMWLHNTVFLSPLNSSSWNHGRMSVYHYTVLSKQWTCGVCTLLNDAVDSVCVACTSRGKSVRQRQVVQTNPKGNR